MDASFDFVIIDWVVLDNWYAAFERCDPTIFEHSTHHRIERKEQAPGLPRDRIAKIHANVGIRIEREELANGKVEVQGRRYLQIANILRRTVTGNTEVIAHQRNKVAVRANLGQHDAEGRSGHH